MLKINILIFPVCLLAGKEETSLFKWVREKNYNHFQSAVDTFVAQVGNVLNCCRNLVLPKIFREKNVETHGAAETREFRNDGA